MDNRICLGGNDPKYVFTKKKSRIEKKQQSMTWFINVMALDAAHVRLNLFFISQSSDKVSR